MKNQRVVLLMGITVLLLLGIAFFIAAEWDKTSPKAIFERLEMALGSYSAWRPEAERAVLMDKSSAINFYGSYTYISDYILYKGYGGTADYEDELYFGVDVVQISSEKEETAVTLQLAFNEKEHWSPYDGLRLFQYLSGQLAQNCLRDPKQRRLLSERIETMIKGYAAGEATGWSQDEIQMSRNEETPRWQCASSMETRTDANPLKPASTTPTDSPPRWFFTTTITIDYKPKDTFVKEWTPLWLLTWLRGGVTVKWLHPPTYFYLGVNEFNKKEGRLLTRQYENGSWTLRDKYRNDIPKEDFEAFFISSFGGDDSSKRWTWVRENGNGPWTRRDDQENVLKKDFEAFFHSSFGGNDFSEGRVWARESDMSGSWTRSWTLLDDRGNVLKKDFEAPSIGKYEDGVARFGIDGLTIGFLDRSGDVISSPRNYGTWGGGYGEGLISQQGEDGRLGFVDLNGQWVIPPVYEYVFPFREGLAAAVKDKKGKWGFIDKSGDVAIDFKYDGIWFWFSHGMAAVQVDSKYGLIDPRGNWIAEPIYDNIGGPRCSYPFAMEKDGKVGFIDSKGDVVIDFKFLSAKKYKEKWLGIYRFEDGLATVILGESRDGKPQYGVIDETGKVLFRTGDRSGLVWNGFLVNRDGEREWALTDKSGKRHPFPPKFKGPPVWITPTEDGIFTYRDEKRQKMGYFTIEK